MSKMFNTLYLSVCLWHNFLISNVILFFCFFDSNRLTFDKAQLTRPSWTPAVCGKVSPAFSRYHCILYKMYPCVNRLYPTIPRLERIAKQTVEINGITIPKDMLIMVPIYALHRDPEFWPEPEEFKPERWRTKGERWLRRSAQKNRGNISFKAVCSTIDSAS